MYTIYAGDKLIYSPILAADGYAVINPKLTKQLNKADSLDFILPPTNPNFAEVTTMLPLVTVYENNRRIFCGRCIKDESDFDNRKPLHCEGELAFLNDSIVRPYDFKGTVKDYFRFLIENHNNSVEIEKQFTVGEITVVGDTIILPQTDAAILKRGSSGQSVKTLQSQLTQLGYYVPTTGFFGSQTQTQVKAFQRDNNLTVDGIVGKETRAAISRALFGGTSTTTDYIERVGNDYSTTFNEIKTQLLDKLGGYIMPRYVKNDDGTYTEYLDYLAVSGGDNSQTIEFGQNLLDLKTQFNVNDVFTVLIPLGAKTSSDANAKRLTIESVNGGKDFLVNEAALAYFGKIEKTVIYEDVSSANELYRRASELVLTGVNVSVTITARAVDLSTLWVEIDKLVVGEYNQVYSEAHSIDASFQHTRAEIDLTNPSKSVYTFGVTLPRLTDKKGVVK